MTTLPVCRRRRTSATRGATTLLSVTAGAAAAVAPFGTVASTTTSSSSSPHFTVRRLGPSTITTTTTTLVFDHDFQHNNPRGLFDVVPTLSQDGGIHTELPPLVLELQGTNGDTLSVDALLTIEYAMADYLEELFQPRWPDIDDDDDSAPGIGVGIEYNDAQGSSFVPALARVRTLVVNDQPWFGGGGEEGGSGGNNNRRVLQGTNDIVGNMLELIATLTFRDQSPPTTAPATTSTTTTQDTTATTTATTMDNTVEGEIPDDDALLRQANEETAMSLPSNTNLDAAAGDAWNDLDVFFGDWLFPAIALDADPTVQQELVNLTGVSSATVYPTSAPVEGGGDGAADETSPPATDVTTEAPGTDIVGGGDSNSSTSAPGDDNNNNNNTVAGINDATYLSQNDNGGIDPLYPAIAAGIAVFLCTIIVLGYRRQSRQMDHLIGNKAEPPIHVHDSTFLDDGEEEIEVEDHYYMNQEKSMVGTQCGVGGRRRRNRDGGDYDPYNDDDDEDYDLEQDRRSDARSGSSRRNSFRGDATEEVLEPTAAEMEEFDVYATLNPQEKSAFLRYINQGLSVQQAQQQIFADRAHPSLAVNGPRSPHEDRPTSRRNMKSREKLQTEVMPDGKTMVHVPEDLSSHGLSGGGGNSSRSIGHDGRIVSHGGGGNDKNRGSRRSSRAMRISDASSSVGSSSFDDRDFLQNASSGALDGPSPSGEIGVNRSRFSLGGHRKNDRPQRGQVMVLPGSEI